MAFSFRLRPIEYLTAWLPFRYVEQRYEIANNVYRVRTPKKLHQLYDRTDHPGISEAAFPLIGIVWPSGEVLAQLVSEEHHDGLAVLEMGCGMALPSLVLAKLGADITAMDIHPYAGEYLQINARINQLSAVRFVEASWSDSTADLGRFDLIIGSDLLYEPQHARHLAAFVDRHLNQTGRLKLVDPGRGQARSFLKDMKNLGFTHTTESITPDEMPALDYPVEVLAFYRG